MLRGEHVASVTIENFFTLPAHDQPLKRGFELDQPVQFADGVEAGRFLIYVNAEAPTFWATPLFVFKLERSTLGTPLFVGVTAVEQAPLRSPPEGGIIVLAGWNPQMPDPQRDEMPFLYVRGI